ncbi:MAG: glycosyltransferase family 2 protein [Candidatus Saelkia tenebricola]|nr:glycosyltransferase family 2 protein [Candidatus Saelkia tenebricola]
MKVSVVIPLYNEQENINLLYSELKEVLDGIDAEYEILFINDGSEDESLALLRSINSNDSQVKLISFQKNYGQSAALKAGFERSLGEVIVTMDADLQNDPHDIPKLMSCINQGYDLVSGWRKKRVDSLKKRISSKIANRVRNSIIRDNINDTGCMLKAYRKDAIKGLEIYSGMHRFLPVLLKMRGAKVVEIEVNHRARRFGKTKYGIKNRLWKSLIDTFIVLWMKKNYINLQIKEEL